MDRETAREINDVRAEVDRERSERMNGEDDIRRAVAMDLAELRREIAELRARVSPVPQPRPSTV